MTLFAKLWTDIIGDPKLMRAARKGARELEFLPWLIAWAKKADDSGRLSVGGESADPEDIAHGIPGATAKRVARCLTELTTLGVLRRDRDGVLRFRGRYLRRFRPGVPLAVRRAVWARDGGRCRGCGATEQLQYDHVYPYSRGGPATIENIQLLCERCNRAKGATVAEEATA